MRHQPGIGRHHSHLETAEAQVIGELATDQAGTYDQHTPTPFQRRTEPAIVGQIIDRQKTFAQRLTPGQCAHLRAGREHQITVGQAAVTQTNQALTGIDGGHLLPGQHLGTQLFGHGLGILHGQLIGFLALGKAGRQQRF